MSPTYNNQAVQEILQEAAILQKDNDISRKQLQEIATEVGITVATLEKAEQAWLARQERSQQQVKRRTAFIRCHLIPYLVVSVFLVLLNFATSSQYFWSIYPILGWGLGVTIDGLCTSPAENQNNKDQ